MVAVLTEDLGIKVTLGWSKLLFLSFVFGFVVRLIPELLSLPYPIGYDSIHYTLRIRSGVVWYHWSHGFSTWLLYAILIGLFNATQIDPFALVKLSAALLFGFNACGIHYFATKALGWTNKKGLLAGVFFSLQMASLALSANFYRNMLALGILLFALPLIKDDLGSRNRLLVFMLLSVLVVFSHEFGSVILFAAVLGVLGSRLLKGTKVDVSKVLMAISVALVLFFTSVFFIVSPIPTEAEKNVIWVESLGNYPGVIFFLRNYLAIHETAQYYPMYLDLASQVFSFFAVLYVVALPLVLAGFFKDDVLNSWTTMLLIGSFGALVMPFYALDFWYRWMLMLVYPFTFYAVNGIAKVLQSSRKAANLTLRHSRLMRMAHRAVKLVLIVPFSLGLVFVATAIQGSAVPLRDVDDTISVMQWLNAQMDDGSTLLSHDAFFNWARLYLDQRQIIIRFKDDFEGAINAALQRGFNSVYFVWWNKDTGLYDLALSEGFVAIFSSGRISVFEYFL